MVRRLVLAALLAGVALPATAAPPAIPLDTLKTVTKTLSQDSFEGRAPATPGEDKTVAYIAERFAAAGLKPGVRGGWYQPVPLVELTLKNTPAITVTGGRTPLSFAYKTDMVIGTYRVVPQVAVESSDVVFVGYGINAPEKGWNDYAGLDVKGKTVVILVNDPDWQARATTGLFDGRAMTYYGRWTYKFEEAARQGAAMALIVHDTAPAAYGFNVVRSSWSGPQLETDEKGDHLDQSAAVGWLTNEAARKLFASAGKDLDTLTAAAKVKGFRPVPLGLKAGVSLENGIRRQASRNVIGIIPGSTTPDEYVLYSAHWDHLGRCEPVNGDDICNGAVDNASGVAGLVALAEAFRAGGPPKRSVVFLALTAEESGTLGSEYYANNPVYPRAKTVGGANMDSLNLLGDPRDISLVGAGKSDLEGLLTRLATAQGRVVKPEPTPEKGFYYRSDHFSFAKLGVPMIYFDGGDDLVKGGVAAGQKAKAAYEATRYHAPSDEYDPEWDWSGAVHDLQLYYGIGRALADGGTWPKWNPGSEFRAVRDASEAAR
ncbi:M28 family peptidase [Sphingomonas solaris]|uniref:M28 family peptidase n=1 Tax=Alterirhizorhabdus solaris TaxID=2529389 RepID=A0A558R8S4_9SPHN|nr:M28 family peptidase [Sphingomonas solaris]